MRRAWRWMAIGVVIASTVAVLVHEQPAKADTLVSGSVPTAAAPSASSWSAATSVDPDVGPLPLRWTGHPQPNHFDGELIGLESVSCGSPTFCAAVGGALERGHERGYVLTFTDDAWSRPLRVRGELQLISVSCVSSSFCAAIGNRTTGAHTFAGYALIYNGRTWSKPKLLVEGSTERDERPSELEMVSCATRFFCAVTNQAGEVFRYNGRSWTEAVSNYPRGV